MRTAKDVITDLLQSARIIINGAEQWDIHVHNDKFYSRVLNEGPLGLGESYMDKWWDCDRLDIFFEKILRAELNNKIKMPSRLYIKHLLAQIYNYQSRHRAQHVADQHYNLGNSLFISILDSRLIYSCGYWKDARTLEEAQLAKLELTCQKLKLKPGMRLLDVGCGWGGLAKYAAEKYGVSVTGLTISKEQADYAREYCKNLPIDIRLQDYRDINEKFDRIVSIGMFEHVGHGNYKNFFSIMNRSLTDDGIFLLHTIGQNKTGSFANEWTLKYIFPNGMLPSLAQISTASEKLFIVEDLHNFGADYDNTLMAWYENFTHNWNDIKSQYDERFYRMWTYYLLSSAGAFRARQMQLWQIVFSKNGLIGGYKAAR